MAHTQLYIFDIFSNADGLVPVEGVTSGFNASDVMHFKQHKDNPTQTPINQEDAVDHINEAQSALENGDTAKAQMHLDLAKQALSCNPMDPRCLCQNWKDSLSDKEGLTICQSYFEYFTK